MDFFIRMARIASELGTLLDHRYVPGQTEYDGPVGRAFHWILKYHNDGQYHLRALELTRLQFLAKHLREVRDYNADLFEDLCSEIREAERGQLDRYFGPRFEVDVAASLIRSGVDFSKRESPDFSVRQDGEEVFVECTSRHLEKPKDTDVRYKIGQEIRSKGEKDYCSPDTAIFVETTNIFAHMLHAGTLSSTEDLRDYLTEDLATTEFGAGVFFVVMVNEDVEPARVEWNYLRVDRSNAASALTSFLDESFPVNGVEASQYRFPYVP